MAKKALPPLKILRLEAENVKRLKVVEISPKGDVIEIAGKNGQGKTSVLDSILWALGGGREIQWQPIRAGEAKAKIVLDLGDLDGDLQLQVTRTFTAQDDGTFTTALKVTNADGFRPDKPQDLLTTLVGALSFDPGAFIRSAPSAQIDILKTVIRRMDPSVNFEAIEKDRKEFFDERTDKAREEKRLRAAAAAAVVPDDAPEAAVNVEALLAQLDTMANATWAHGRLVSARADVTRRRDEAKDELGELEERVADLKERVASLDAVLAQALPPEPESSADVRQQLTDAQRLNDAFAARRNRDDLIRRADQAKADVDLLTTAIATRDAELRDLIERAELPVSGLELGPDAVMLRGVPFNQASDAEQLRAAMAMAMAANPRLRVIRIRDGSLLDEDAMKVIADVAHEMGFQIWMERVGRGSDDGDVVLMENGEVSNG